MRKLLLTALLALTAMAGLQAQDTIWIRNDNRFKANTAIDIAKYDSIEFRTNIYKDTVPVRRSYSSTFVSKGYFDFSIPTSTDGTNFSYMFTNPGRIVYQVSSIKNIDFMTDYGQYSFQRSKESEHFIVFWEKGFGDDPKTAANYQFDPDALLTLAEKVWDKYVADLGFIQPGKSTTDRYKIIMFVHYSGDWLATGSGEDGKSGLLNVTPWAISARGGHTVAHEVGHTFQYLVNCDLGSDHGFNYGYGDFAGNGWWESCADWQAYKVFPDRQFTDGEYYENYMSKHHLNLLHEDMRYDNCFIQDWWCQLYGLDFIGRLWRASVKPNDPVQVYQKMNNLTQEQFNDEMMEGFMHFATWDIDAVRQQAKHRIGNEATHLHQAGDWWEVDSAYCPQNYGYNTINLNYTSPGTVIKANFKGIAGQNGYRKVNVDKAGWRYGFVAYTKDGETVYGEVGKDKTGSVTMTVPSGCEKLFFVVMGAPTEHWQHPWDSDITNDEQWPYQVQFENTNIYGQYGDYADDYVRRDTTVYVDAELAASNSYSSVTVNYDMGIVSRCLGLSTKQLSTFGSSKAANPRFLAVNADGSYYYGTTTTTSSSTVYGHWFDASGNVCSYNNSAYIFAEYNKNTFKCSVGQYPNHLTAGKTYTIRQAFQYDKGGKTYTVTFVVRLKVV